MLEKVETVEQREMREMVKKESVGLSLYEDARRALAECTRIDEVKSIRDKAEALRIYARQAKDTELERHAIEIRLRAERRAGALMAEQRTAGLLARKEDNQNTVVLDQNNRKLTLADLGVTRKQSADWSNLANLLEPEFEARLERVLEAKPNIPANTVLRMANISANADRGTAERGIEVESDKWHTPSEIIELAREVMGGIDLDPASNASAQRTVKAQRFFDRKTDGLAQIWEGRIWLNPPYSQPLIEQFVSKLIDEFDSRRVAQAIVLTNNATDTDWFQQLVRISHTLFSRKRIQFLRPGDDETSSPRQGQAFFYIGKRVERFRDLFKEVAYNVTS